MEQTEQDTRSWPEVIIHTANFVVSGVGSLTGNSLIFLAFYRNRRLRNVTNFYVVSLAVADVMMVICCFPFHISASGLRGWPFNHNLCQFIGFIVHCWAQISVCILTLASINRYCCVLKADKYPAYFSRKNTIMSILIVWIASLLETLIFVFTVQVAYRWSPESLFCRATTSDETTEMISYVFFGSFFTLLMTLATFCYVRVYYAIRRHNNAVVPSLHDTNSPGVISAQEIKTSRVLFAAVIGFVICWTPLTIVLILDFGLHISISPSALSIFMLLTSYSSWINPVIYGVMNRAMRKEFRRILCGSKEN